MQATAMKVLHITAAQMPNVIWRTSPGLAGLWCASPRGKNKMPKGEAHLHVLHRYSNLLDRGGNTDHGCVGSK